MNAAARGASRPPVVLALSLIVLGALGWIAAFTLTVEKFVLLETPGAVLGCDFSLVVQCGKNLSSAQGALFGFPNPLLGIAGFVAPIAVGVGLLAGARFARWFWLLLNLGVAGALAFVIWLISQSIYVLGTLCPWCMVVWAVTIPLFLLVTLVNLAEGRLGGRGRAAGRRLLPYVVPMSVAAYLVIALLAQLRLDVLSYLV